MTTAMELSFNTLICCYGISIFFTLTALVGLVDAVGAWLRRLKRKRGGEMNRVF